MKQRFTLIASALLIAAAGSMDAANPAADKVRIYINPGHGSWTGNDRPMQTIGRKPYDAVNTDTTGFFESNTNLRKGFGMLDALRAAGVPFDATKNQTNSNPARVGAALDLSQNIVMSHVKAGPFPNVAKDDPTAEAYNRSLTEIREEVEANNFDLFVSIHSNAASSETSNYPLFLYRGTDEDDAVDGSRALSEHLWPYTFNNAHQQWSYYSPTSMNVRGDVSFYGSSWTTNNNGTDYTGYLGVLLHGVPGFLVEGYFHTYAPSRQRAMNWDVDRHEGHLYARGIIDYMGWQKQKTGEIYGIVRDLHEKFTDPLYKAIAGTIDQYKPLNEVKVTLSKDGKEVKTYTTDKEYNGAFYFADLEPGEYTLSYAAEGYKPAFEEFTAPVVVKANETSYVTPQLEAEGYEPPKVTYVNYPDPVATSKAYNAGSEYNFKTEIDNAAPAADQLAGKTIRRQIVRNGNAYVLALDANNEPSIYRINLADNTVTATSNECATAYNNRDLKISDIAFTADNVLIASSYGENQFSDGQIREGDVRGTLAIYKWANDDKGLPTGNPTTWLTSQHSGNYYNALVGQTLAYSGTSVDGAVMTTAQTIGSSTSLRWLELGVSNGEHATTTFINKNVSASSEYTATKLGQDYALSASPRATDSWVVDGSATTPIEFQRAGDNTDAPLLGRVDAAQIPAEATGVSFFKYAGKDMMVTPTFAEGKANGLRLFDVTAGLDKAVEISVNNTAVTPNDAKFVSATGQGVATTDDEGNITAANMELFLVRDGSITKFTTAGTEQPKICGEYAYALAQKVGESQTEFTFKATGDAPNANIIIRKDGEQVHTVAVGAVKAGENTATVNNSDLPEGELTWEVEVAEKSVAQPTLISKIDGYQKARGIAIDNSPKSKFFGNIYIGNCTANESFEKGIYIYDPTLQMQGEHAYGASSWPAEHTASPYRLNVNENGVVFISGWNDENAGIRLLDPANLPANPTDDLPCFFTFTERKSNGGLWNDGQYISGSTTCAYVWGSGENTRLFTFDEDHEGSNNVILRYDIGTNMTWGKPADMNLGQARMLNTDVQLIATENGVWAAQTRYSPNNIEGCPSLVYVDMEGNILFNSGNATTAAVLKGTRGSGFAISRDGKTMAIVNDPTNYTIFDITWNGNTPNLTHRYTINSGRTAAVNQMAFDYAGNLYAMHQDGLQVFSLPSEETTVTTPAAGTFHIAAGSGVEDAVAEVASIYPNPATDVIRVNATAEISTIAVYNVAGAAVNVEASVEGNAATINVAHLAKGIYILKVNDGKATRFIKK